jgi:xylulokinase
LGLERGMLVVTGGFDQAMAMLGSGALDPGTAHVGTGSYEALSAPLDTPLTSDGLRAGGWSVGRSVAGSVRWSMMASWPGGTVLSWLAGGTSDAWPRGPSLSVARLLREVQDRPARLIALSGLEGGSGAVLGMDLGSRRGDMAAAVLEAVSLDLRHALADLERAGVAVGTLRATGGGARSRRWLQLKADVTGRVVERTAIREAGAFAGGLLAGAAVGMLPSPADAARTLVRVDVRVEPRRALEAHYTERAALHTELRAALSTLPAVASFEPRG